MKYFLNGILAALFTSTLPAQITIGDADMPNAGDSVRVSLATNTGTVDYTLTGTGYVWDFSSLVPFGQERIEYNTPTALPFNFFSDYGVTNNSPDSLPGIGALPTNFTDYFKSSSSSFRQIGSSFDYAPIGSFSIPLINSAPDYIYLFPLNYGDMDTSDAAYSLTLPGLGFIGQDKHRENHVDGWGTLITPYDTFQVLRVRSVVNATDTFSFDTTNQTGFSIPRPTVIEYKWLALGMKHPVLEVDVQIVQSLEVISSVVYIDSIRDSLFQVAVLEPVHHLPSISVFPCPAHEVVYVYLDESSSDLTFRMIDLTGQIVLNETENAQTSTGIKEINVAGYASGIYFLEVESAKGIAVRKIIID